MSRQGFEKVSHIDELEGKLPLMLKAMVPKIGVYVRELNSSTHEIIIEDGFIYYKGSLNGLLHSTKKS